MADAITQRSSYKGLPLSGGLALGSVCMFNDSRHNELPVYRVAEKDVASEEARLTRAMHIVRERLETIRDNVRENIGQAEGEIFTAQIMILGDETIAGEVKGMITGGKRNAEVAVSTVLDGFEARMLKLDDEYIRERASDIGEVKRRLLDVLTNLRPALQCAGSAGCRHGRNRIIIAEELLPTLTVDIDTTDTLGFVTERGGANSHAAILARALGIPAVSGLPGLRGKVTCGTPVLVDGDRGEVVIWPDENDLVRFRDEKPRKAAGVVVAPIPDFPVKANISTQGDAELALKFGAEGIGLYRTEFEFMAAGRRLTVEEQFARYVQVLRVMEGRPVTFRLIDAGGDKPLSFLRSEAEENPALGWRGMRLLLGEPGLLRDQLEALVRASTIGPVRVLAPMITDLSQYRAFRDIYDAVLEAGDTGDIRHGIMLEVPSACLQAAELLREVDFASIGTNDLIQYLFAVDRNNDRVAADYRTDYPVFWRLLEQMLAAAREARVPLGVCGEMIAMPTNAQRLYEMGFDEVSVSPRLIPLVREAVKEFKEGGVV